MTKFNAIQCPNCKDIIYSVARHDFNFCTCKSVSIDGNSNVNNKYFRVGGTDLNESHMTQIEVDATPKELYDDWNLSSIDKPRKYGTIKGIK